MILEEAIQDKHVPDDFYSTTNYQTFVFYNNKWIEVNHQRMDAVLLSNEIKAINSSY